MLHLSAYGLVLQQNGYFLIDSVQYLTLADHLLTKGVYSQEYAPPYIPDTQYLPAYPAYLAACLRAAPAVLLGQLLMLWASGRLLYLLARRVIRPGLARRVAGFYLLQPYAWLFALLIMPEMMFITLTLLGLWAAVRCWARPRLGWAALALGAWAMLSLTKGLGLPVLLLGCAGLSALVVFQRFKRPALLLALVLPLLLLGGWSYRNAQITGSLSLSTQGYIPFWYGRVGGVLLMDEAEPAQLPPAHRLMYRADRLGYATVRGGALYRFRGGKQHLGTAQLHPRARKAGWAVLTAEPLRLLRFHLQSYWQMAKGIAYGTAQRVLQHRKLAYAAAALQGLCNLVMAGGLLLWLWRLRRASWLSWAALGLAALYTLLHAAAWADGRYRMIADPLFCLMLAHAWSSVQARRALNKQPQA
jgi:hypothetical protein